MRFWDLTQVRIALVGLACGMSTISCENARDRNYGVASQTGSATSEADEAPSKGEASRRPQVPMTEAGAPSADTDAGGGIATASAVASSLVPTDGAVATNSALTTDSPAVSGAPSMTDPASSSSGPVPSVSASSAVSEPPPNAVIVQLASDQQVMAGFGIGNMFMPDELTEPEAVALFDPDSGLGLSIFRIGMGSNGGPISDNTWSDVLKAKAQGVNTFIGTVWSAPANCKSNDSVRDGGHLLAGCQADWADMIAAFPGLVKQNAGVDLYALSPQNEPDYATCPGAAPCNGSYESMVYTASEMTSFVKVVGPKLRALSPPVKVIAPETRQWRRLWSNTSVTGSIDPLMGTGYDYVHALAADPTAWAQVDLIGTHQYDDQVAAPWPGDLSQRKPLWMTEMSGQQGWPEQGPSSTIANGIAVAGWIHDAVVNGQAEAWLWWVFPTPFADDNEGLVLKDGTDTKRRYTIGQYSRFIRPGYVRVDVTGPIPSDVLLSAYKGMDGQIVVVAINRGSAAVTIPLYIAGGAVPFSLTPWVTSESDSLVAKTAIQSSEGGFTVSLPGTSVTSLVRE